MKFISKIFNFLFSVKLPKEGSVYTHNKKGSVYNGMKGIVFHHSDKKVFMIKCENSWLCNIKP
jgi:hypothetical protein